VAGIEVVMVMPPGWCVFLKQHDDMTRPIVMRRAGLTVRCAISSDW
jgi:hypothetical protein